MQLKKVKGANIGEKIASIDSWLESMDRKAKLKTPDDKLRQEVTELRLCFTALLEHLGLEVIPGPVRQVKQVKLIEDSNALSTNST